MIDADKVIKGLEFCNSSEDCRGCVYFSDALKGKCKCGTDALELIKEQRELLIKKQRDLNNVLCELSKLRHKMAEEPDIVRCIDCLHGGVDADTVICDKDGTNHDWNWYCADGV